MSNFLKFSCNSSLYCKWEMKSEHRKCDTQFHFRAVNCWHIGFINQLGVFVVSLGSKVGWSQSRISLHIFFTSNYFTYVCRLVNKTPLSHFT
jgi:hypothetical protein